MLTAWSPWRSTWAPPSGRRPASAASSASSSTPSPPSPSRPPSAATCSASGPGSPTACSGSPTPPAPPCGRGAASDRPRARRPLAGADVVHGTNYVVPPSGLPERRHRPRLLVPHPPRPGERHRAGLRPGAAAGGRPGRVGAHAVGLRRPAGRASCSAPARVRVDPPRAAGAGRPVALGGAAARPRRPALRAGRRHPRAAQEPDPAGRGVRPPARRATPTSPSCWWARTAPTGPTSTPPSPPCPAPAAEQVLLTDWVSEDQRAARRWPGARVLAYPSLDEGFGFPLLEAMQAGRAGRRRRRRRHPRGRRRRRPPRRPPRPGRPGRRPGRRHHRRRGARPASWPPAGPGWRRSRGRASADAFVALYGDAAMDAAP